MIFYFCRSESKELSKELSSIHDSSDLPAKVKSENIPLNNHKNSNNKNSCNGSSGSPLAPTGADIKKESASSGVSSAPSATIAAPSATKAAPSALSKEKAASYLSDVKKNLKDHLDSYQRFTAALKKYQKENQFEELTQVLVDVFLSREQWHPLLRGFYHFLRLNHKERFNELCFNLTGRKCDGVA